VGGDVGLDIGGTQQIVRVRDRGEVAFGSQVLAAAQVDVVDDGVSRVRIVVGEDGLLGAVLEYGALHQDLGQVARVDPSVTEVGVVGAVKGKGPEMLVHEAKTRRGGSRFLLLPLR
jgi:hypothetical protein